MPGQMIRRAQSPSSTRQASATHGAKSADIHNRTRETPNVHGRAILRGMGDVAEPQGFTVQFPAGQEPTTVSTASLQQAAQQRSPLSQLPWWGWLAIAVGGYYLLQDMK